MKKRKMLLTLLLTHTIFFFVIEVSNISFLTNHYFFCMPCTSNRCQVCPYNAKILNLLVPNIGRLRLPRRPLLYLVNAYIASSL